LALLDDVVVLAKAAAASVDEVAATSMQVGAKAAGVVVDDAAVTPGYLRGFPPARELPVVARIAWGSFRNKVVYLLPGALLLSTVAPAVVPALLAAGGGFLCFEGAEKLMARRRGEAGLHEIAAAIDDLAAFEDARVASAVRTDFVLSGEIMAIALGEVAETPLLQRGLVLFVVGTAITVLVYGSVAALVKADDLGLHAAQEGRTAAVRAIGRGVLRAMPSVMGALSTVGMAAMLWVGGHIVLDALEAFGLPGPVETLHHMQDVAAVLAGPAGGLAGWLVGTVYAGVFGVAVGAGIAGVLHRASRRGRR
jgi:predicted DNA repair protein MutK